jgi:hypothetical protein
MARAAVWAPSAPARTVLVTSSATRCTDSTCCQGALVEGTFQGVAATLQTQALLGRSKHDAGSRANLGLFDLHVVAAADTRVNALQTIKANDVQALVFGIGGDGDGGGVALADDLDSLSFLKAHLCECLLAHASDAAA